jgi:hypothetical protein
MVVKMTKIYESPDGGKTVYERESGETDRTFVYVDIDEETVTWDYDDSSTISISGSTLNSGSISSSAIYGLPYNGSITDANASYDIKFQDETGKMYSFKEMYKSLEAIEKRLAILKPDDKLLEKYQILHDLYEQYKAAEALLYDNEDE